MHVEKNGKKKERSVSSASRFIPEDELHSTIHH